MDYRLSNSQCNSLADTHCADFQYALKYMCLFNGCWHCHSELYVSSGKLMPLPKITWSGWSIMSTLLIKNPMPRRFVPCLNVCPVCTGQWKQFFLPVRKDWFDDVVPYALPCTAAVDNLCNLLDWKLRTWEFFQKAVLRAS